MYDFEYVRPITMASAQHALSKDGAQPIGGGQSLIPTLKQRLAQPVALVDVKTLPGAQSIRMEGDAVVIGCAATHASVAGSTDVKSAIPALAELAGMIGDPQVRNRGTIGGSLANNDPSACYPAAALALGATIVTDKREIAADDYFKGLFETALDQGEIIMGVSFPKPKRAAYMKFLQPASRFALVGVFVADAANGVRVAVTGASEEGVFRHQGLEQALSANFAPQAVDGVEVSASGLIGDLHGTPEYRAHLIKVMTERAVAKAIG